MKIKVTRKAQDEDYDDKILVSFVDQNGEILEKYDEDLGSFVDEDGNIIEDINNSDYYMQFGMDIMKPSEFMDEGKLSNANPKSIEIIDLLEEIAQDNYSESLWQNDDEEDEFGLISGAKYKVIDVINDCLKENCSAETIVKKIDQVIYSMFHETLFKRGSGLIYGAKKEAISEIKEILGISNDYAQDGAFDDVDELYEELTERGLFTNDELKLLTKINGYSVETLNDAIYARHGYRTLSQMLGKDDEEDDFEDDNDGVKTFRGADFLKKKPSAEILKANKKEYQEKQSKTKEEDKDLKKIGTEHFYEVYLPRYKENRSMNTLQDALNVFDDISRDLHMSKYFKEGAGDRRNNKYFWKLVDNFATIEIKKVYSTLIDKFDHDVIKDGPTYLKERMQDLKRKYGIIIM